MRPEQERAGKNCPDCGCFWGKPDPDKIAIETCPRCEGQERSSVVIKGTEYLIEEGKKA